MTNSEIVELANRHGLGHDPNVIRMMAVVAERLTAENERLRAALGEIANYWGAENDDAEPCREIARRALNQQSAVNSEEGK